MKDCKILQIIPAAGWSMLSGRETDLAHSPLVCWALCETKNGDTFVTGMFRGPSGSPDLHLCTDVSSFSTYAQDNEDHL